MVCRTYLFFLPNIYHIVYRTDGAIPDKKGEKRKLTILELHANNEISSSSNMHIAREPAKGK
jgi:hypothetical protein